MPLLVLPLLPVNCQGHFSLSMFLSAYAALLLRALSSSTLEEPLVGFSFPLWGG
jgi:hypothetical protein